MIPKVAHFYWYGEEEMPALRRESVQSFSALNPEWKVNVHHSGDNPQATLRERIVRSDAARYGILSRDGGVYFDTDIVFVRPIPDALLACDVLLPATGSGSMYGVHVLGSAPNSPFFAYAVARARMRMESPRMLGCQSLGVKLWEGINVLDLSARENLHAVIVPIGAFLMNGWQDVEDLWSKGGEIDRNAIGLHWYGGDPLSREFENVPYEKLPDSLVRTALERTHVTA